MIWEEILIDRNITSTEISSTVAEVFSVDIHSIVVVEDISDPSVDNSKPLAQPLVPRIVIESTDIGGDFYRKLTFYISEQEVSFNVIDKIDRIAHMCHKLDCKALISDEDVNPYSMNLVNTDGSIEKIFLDVDKLDDDGQFTIKRVA
jgi:hypothetical protein